MDWSALKKGLTKVGVLEEDAPASRTENAGSPPDSHPNIHPTGAVILTEDIDRQFVTALRNAANESKVRGFQEFQDQLGAFEDEEPDEGKRIRLAAKSAAQAYKLRTDQIIDSLRDRMRLLQKEYDETEAGFARQSETQVAAKEASIKTIDSQIALKQQEIDQLQQQKQRAETEVLSLKKKIDTAKAKFEAAYKFVKAEYESNLDKITAILK